MRSRYFFLSAKGCISNPTTLSKREGRGKRGRNKNHLIKQKKKLTPQSPSPPLGALIHTPHLASQNCSCTFSIHARFKHYSYFYQLSLNWSAKIPKKASLLAVVSAVSAVTKSSRDITLSFK